MAHVELETPQVEVGEEPVSELLAMFAPYNPRKISKDQLLALRRSLTTFGVVEPVVANRRTRRIVGGHQRLRAAEAEGIERFPVAWVDLDEVAEKQLNLALNRISGEWDEDRLAALLQDLKLSDADLGLTGFTDTELAQFFNVRGTGLTNPDEIPEKVPELVVPGDLWSLGSHRLICGDATEAIDQARLFDGAKPLLCVTDPPYGVGYDAAWRDRVFPAANRRKGKVTNDDCADWAGVWALMPCEVVYAWCAAGNPQIMAGQALVSAGYQIRASLIWKKTNFRLSRGHYTFTHEPCWYAVRKGAKAHWTGGHAARTVWEEDLDKNVPGGHSTQKPVALMARSIENHKGDVFDPFCGSGTTLIACESLSRPCFAMEIDPHYCDTILARWEAFTGHEPEKLEGA